MHSPLWHFAWSARQNPGTTGGCGGLTTTIVVAGAGVVATGLLRSATDLQFNLATLDVSQCITLCGSSPTCCGWPRSNLQPAGRAEATHRNRSHHSYHGNLVDCHTGIPTGYKCRRHTCAHRACTVWCQGLLRKMRGGRRRDVVTWFQENQCTTSQFRTNKAAISSRQHNQSILTLGGYTRHAQRVTRLLALNPTRIKYTDALPVGFVRLKISERFLSLVNYSHLVGSPLR